MSQKPETVFRQKFRKRLDALPNCFWESIQQKAISGTPDILGCVNGYFVGLELKASDQEEPTQLQKLKLSRIAAAGGLGIVVNPQNADAVLELIRHYALEEKNAPNHVETDQR